MLPRPPTECGTQADPGSTAVHRSICCRAGASINSDAAQAPARALCGFVDSARARILELIAEGQFEQEIARSLAIAPATVKSHVKNIFDSSRSRKRAQAIARAQSLGLLKTVCRPELSRGPGEQRPALCLTVVSARSLSAPIGASSRAPGLECRKRSALAKNKGREPTTVTHPSPKMTARSRLWPRPCVNSQPTHCPWLCDWRRRQ